MPHMTSHRHHHLGLSVSTFCLEDNFNVYLPGLFGVFTRLTIFSCHTVNSRQRLKEKIIMRSLCQILNFTCFLITRQTLHTFCKINFYLDCFVITWKTLDKMCSKDVLVWKASESDDSGLFTSNYTLNQTLPLHFTLRFIESPWRVFRRGMVICAIKS